MKEKQEITDFVNRLYGELVPIINGYTLREVEEAFSNIITDIKLNSPINLQQSYPQQ